MDPKLLSRMQRDTNPVHTLTRPLFGCTALHVCSGLMALTPVDRCAKKSRQMDLGLLALRFSHRHEMEERLYIFECMTLYELGLHESLARVKNDHKKPRENKGQREKQKE